MYGVAVGCGDGLGVGVCADTLPPANNPITTNKSSATLKGPDDIDRI
jgi:hypothetical protein